MHDITTTLDTTAADFARALALLAEGRTTMNAATLREASALLRSVNARWDAALEARRARLGS